MRKVTAPPYALAAMPPRFAKASGQTWQLAICFALVFCWLPASAASGQLPRPLLAVSQEPEQQPQETQPQPPSQERAETESQQPGDPQPSGDEPFSYC